MQRYVTVLFITLAMGFTCLAQAAPAPAEIAGTLVRVLVYDNDRLQSSNTGIVIAPDTVLTSADVLEMGQRFAAVTATSGAELAARELWRDKKANLALLSVTGLGQAALPLAVEPVMSGRLVSAVGYHPDSAGALALQAFDGSVSQVEVSQGGLSDLLMHNAAIGKAAFGGALLNNCGELVGLNFTKPRSGFSLLRPRIEEPKGVVYALGLKSLKAVLSLRKVSYKVAGERCLSRAEQQALDAASAKAQAAKAEAQAEQARVRAEQQRKQAETAKKKLEEEARRKEQALQAKLDAEQEKTKAQEVQAKDLEEKLDKERQDKEAEAAQKAALERQQVEDRKRQQQLLAAIAGAVLALLAIVVFVLKRRKKAMLAAHSQAEVAREQAGEASEALNAERARQAYLQTLPDYILEGKTSEGEAIAIKITGKEIGESEQGVVVGRNPAQSGFIINSEEVSREHFRLLFVGEQLMIEDLDSTNGTLLNGETLTAYQPDVLFPGAVIRIGQMELVIRSVQGQSA